MQELGKARIKTCQVLVCRRINCSELVRPAEAILNSPEEPIVSAVLLHAAVSTETQVQAGTGCRPRKIEVARVQHFAHF